MDPILDEQIDDGILTYKYGSLLGWILVLIASYIWYLLFEVKHLQYDDDIANLLGVFLLSVVATIALSFIWFKFENLIRQNIISVILFLLTCSPITVVIVIFNYDKIFGTAMSVN